MQIKDKLNFKIEPVTLGQEDTVQEAVYAMCEKSIGSIIVVNSNQKLSGL